MKTKLLIGVLAIVLFNGCKSDKNKDNNSNRTIIEVSSDTILKFESNSKLGFNFNYVLFLPQGYSNQNINYLIVETNNNGSNDSIEYHQKGAERAARKSSVSNYISKKLKMPLLVPVFPRSRTNWEYISRNKGRSIKYTWGNILPSGNNANFADKNTPYPWANLDVDDKYSYTAPNGSYLPNENGIYDLAGNVWEWCENTIKTYKYEPIEKYENVKAMRGGSFHNKGNTMRTAWRNYDYPNSRYFNLGFRIVNQIKK